MSEQSIRLVTTERRQTMTDRRTSESLARDWQEARGVVALRLDQIGDAQKASDAKVEAALAELRELRPYMRGVARAWAIAGFVAVTIMGAVLVTASRHYTLEALKPAALTQTERVEEIADVLADIPDGIGQRRQDGRPTVAAVRRALSPVGVRGITADEIAAACLLAPEACARAR